MRTYCTASFLLVPSILKIFFYEILDNFCLYNGISRLREEQSYNIFSNTNKDLKKEPLLPVHSKIVEQEQSKAEEPYVVVIFIHFFRMPVIIGSILFSERFRPKISWQMDQQKRLYQNSEILKDIKAQQNKKYTLKKI